MEDKKKATEEPEEDKKEQAAEAGEEDDVIADEGDDEVDVAGLRDALAEMKDSLMRERAEFTNFRKRVLNEKVEMESSATGNVLTELLPALDSFDQLLATRDKEGDLVKFFEGVDLIRKQLSEAFEKFGVEQLDPAGEAFDPASMEALSMSESEDAKEATVEQVYQKGYRTAQRILRAARVAVVQPAQKKEEAVSSKKGE